MFDFLIAVIGVLSVSNVVLMCLNHDLEEGLSFANEKNRVLLSSFNDIDDQLDKICTFEQECE